jgi:hypothetical protein
MEFCFSSYISIQFTSDLAKFDFLWLYHHKKKYEEYCLLGCDTIQSGSSSLTIWKNSLPPPFKVNKYSKQAINKKQAPKPKKAIYDHHLQRQSYKIGCMRLVRIFTNQESKAHMICL